MLDHDEAQSIFQRLITGETLSDGELDHALAHTADCEECRMQFDLDRTAACERIEADLPAAAAAVREGQDLADQYPAVARHVEECERCRTVLAELITEPEPAVAEPPVEPRELFERALTVGLSDPDATVRERAAERLGSFERLAPRALAALADAAAKDPDENVRAAALRALDELDAQVSIPERLIEAWAAEPAKADPFIEGVLARLAGERGVTELVGRAVAGEQALSVTGEQGISGQLTEDATHLRLSLQGLPPKFEHQKLVVAIPRVLELEPSAIEWAGEPGLVPAEKTVRAGSLDLTLGRVPKGTGTEKNKLFERMYLLNPGARRRRTR
jgi:hypothetical protein